MTEKAHEQVEYTAADEIRRMLDADERFDSVSGVTAFRREDKNWLGKNAGYFSFMRNGKLYFVTVDEA